MVYGFVKQSGGHVQIYSEVGHGTTIRIYLPTTDEKAGAAGETGEEALGTFAAKGETVLVVEDDPRVRRVTIARLNALGYRVIEAENGAAGLVALDELGGAVDLLFSDIVMPGEISGSDLAREARRRIPHLKVVLTSGYARPEVLQRGLEGNVGWIKKPHTALELARVLRDTLDP
jgi:CheY-like chemotaxis protein